MKKEEKFSENLKGLFLCDTLCKFFFVTQRSTEGHRDKIIST